MVQGNELRRGNLVEHGHEGILQVVGIGQRRMGLRDFAGAHFDFYFDDVDSIRLTTERLYLLRFIKERTEWIYDNGLFRVKEWGEGFYHIVGGQIIGQQIKFIHRLQNSFFINTGKELDCLSIK